MSEPDEIRSDPVVICGAHAQPWRGAKEVIHCTRTPHPDPHPIHAPQEQHIGATASGLVFAWGAQPAEPPHERCGVCKGWTKPEVTNSGNEWGWWCPHCEITVKVEPRGAQS